MTLLTVSLAVLTMLVAGVLAGRLLERNQLPAPHEVEPLDVHAALDSTGEEVDATVFPLHGARDGRP